MVPFFYQSGGKQIRYLDLNSVKLEITCVNRQLRNRKKGAKDGD